MSRQERYSIFISLTKEENERAEKAKERTATTWKKMFMDGLEVAEKIKEDK